MLTAAVSNDYLYVLVIYNFLNEIYLYILETANRNSRACQIILMNREKSKNV